MGLPRYYNLLDTARGDFVLNAQSLAAIMAVGNSFFVNETTGNDDNVGSSEAPFATLDAAIAAATPNNGDTVFLMGSSHRTSTLNWNKDGVNLVGLLAPSGNDRSRIASTGATPFSPLVDVTGVGCQFINIGTFHGGFTGATGSQVCWAEAGGRNYYQNCQLMGGGDATTAALAGMRSLTIAGSGENLFEGCQIGLDTIIRASQANATLEFLSGTARNEFNGCRFRSYVSDASDVHVLIQSGGDDRYALFDDCAFLNFGTAMNAAITNAGGSPGSNVVLNDCISVGATAIATAGNVFVNQISANGATTTFIGLPAT